eukprot:2602910-Amphidinium_carterae.1
MTCSSGCYLPTVNTATTTTSSEHVLPHLNIAHGDHHSSIPPDQVGDLALLAAHAHGCPTGCFHCFPRITLPMQQASAKRPSQSLVHARWLPPQTSAQRK